jgi:VWFA-related protein
MRLGVKHVWGFAFAALAFTAIGLSVSAQQDSCVKRNIYVRVEDESGHLVEGLTAGNFHATIGKKPVEVRQAAPIPPLREIVIVIDMSGSMHNDFAIRTSLSLAADIVERLPAETLVALVTFNTEPTLEQRFTADRKRINDSIQRLTNASQWKGGSSLYDAVFATVKDLIDKAEPRGNSAVLVISDGGDTSSRIRLEDAETALSASGVRLFAVGIRTQDSYKHSSMFYR